MVYILRVYNQRLLFRIMFIVQAHATLFRDLLSVMYNVKSTSSTADVPLSCRFAGGGDEAFNWSNRGM